MKPKTITLMTLATTLVSSNLLAGTLGSIPGTWTWVGAINAGAMWIENDKTQTLFLAPDIEKTYVANNHSNDALFNGEFFVGGQRSFCSMLIGQLGLAISATSKNRLSGVIWDDGDPLFANFTYSYRTQFTRVAAKGKLLLDKGYWVMPWVSAAVGASFNRSQNYTNTPLIFEALPNPNFAAHTQTEFSYTVGAGVQKAFCHNWQVGLGYEFTDFGKTRLNRAFDQTLGFGLSRNHVYANGVMANITFVA